MASGARNDWPEVAKFRRLLRDARSPERLAANPLPGAICGPGMPQVADSFLAALRVSLHRLSGRERTVVARYDLAGEPVERICTSMALSRRQFFRDHRSALQRLAALMLPATLENGGAWRGAGAAPATVVCTKRSAAEPPRSAAVPSRSAAVPSLSLASGLRNAGCYDDAIAVLARTCDPKGSEPVRIESTLGIAEILAERGDLEGARRELASATALARQHPGAVRRRVAAQMAIVEGHLIPSHREREETYARAVSLLAALEDAHAGDPDDAAVLVCALHALSLSHDHRGDWRAARHAARRSVRIAERFGLAETPGGLLARANDAMRDARQFGAVDGAPDVLRTCLATALRHGWVQVIGDVAVHFINVNLMRSRYAQALAWHRWLASVDASHLGARTRNFLAVDAAHALTMLGYPSRALDVLRSGGDEGLAFAGAREYWRGEALHAAGDAERALRLGLRALDGAAGAESEKGRARSTRLLANCHHALGHPRRARSALAECMELSERYVSPYDLLLSLATARKIGLHAAGDEAELARLLRGSGADADYGPPSDERVPASLA
jgi:tetratricopeptide (TPR) repeat protein